ncbi:DUF605-domain-containing protein [Thozetella sp. PMI_491]|nr:DUF605-domain-containing protein [Thozetella sp. PMI_491]
MADDIPAALKVADMTIFKCATKGVQLQRVKPIISYWCEYWVVNQILAKQLHTTDEEILGYTTRLMDKLEQTKNEYPNEDAITDDVAGQAYVEQFAQETLDRAERVVKANKVTHQTATTFDAAATFFHLVNIWGTPDQETQQKIKYAKWNAARIAKAIKEGKDPNESNPQPQEVQPPALDPDDPEVLALGGISASAPTGPRPATVEDVPDEGGVRHDAAGVSLPQSPVSAPQDDGELQLPGVPGHLNDPAPSPGLPGYFDPPSIPSPVSPPSHNPVNYQPSPEAPPAPPVWAATPPPQDPWQQPQQPPAPPTFAPGVPPTAAVASPPVNPPTNPSYMNMTPSAPAPRPAVPQPSTVVPTYANAPPAGNLVADERAMAAAQKHAKWAISALNFEDVPTAVRELRKALEQLGAT